MPFAFQLVTAFLLLTFCVAPVSAACLSRHIVADAGKPELLTVWVADEEAARLQAKGFVMSSCPTDAVSSTQYRDGICRVASEGNSAVQLRLTQVLGESPAWLCASAQRLLSSPAPEGSSSDRAAPSSPDSPSPDSPPPDALSDVPPQ